MRTTVLRATLAATLLMGSLVPLAAAGSHAQKGPPTDVEKFDAGLTCDFRVKSEAWDRTRSWSKGNLEIVIGPAVTRLTNLDHPRRPSTTVRTNGVVTIKAHRDGSQTITASGTTLFFFYDGDATPDGSSEGGWFLVHGHVRETLSADDIVTSFKLKGWYRSLCGKIAR